jgi:hypothetical protein
MALLNSGGRRLIKSLNPWQRVREGDGPELVRLNDATPRETVTGVVSGVNPSARTIDVRGRLVSSGGGGGEKEGSFTVRIRRAGPRGRTAPVPAEARATDVFSAGDRVELHVYSESWSKALHAYRVLETFPRQGKLTGQCVGVDEGARTLSVRVTAAPAEAGYVEGCLLDCAVPRTAGGRLATLKGHMLEVSYRAGPRLGVVGLRDLGPGPELPREEPAGGSGGSRGLKVRTRGRTPGRGGR